MPTSSIYFTPRRRKNHGITSMKPISDIWPRVILPAALVDADLVQERIGERVVELQRDADQERAEHEDGERPVLHQLQRVEAEDVAQRRRGARLAAAACAAAPGRTGRAPCEPAAGDAASAPRSPRARACRSTSPATIQPIVPSTRIARKLASRIASSGGTRASWSAPASACSRACRRAARRRTRRRSSASRRRRARRRRRGAARRACARWRRSGRRPCRRRTARSSPPAPSCRTPARSARPRNAASRRARCPSSRTTRPRRSTAGTSSRESFTRVVRSGHSIVPLLRSTTRRPAARSASPASSRSTADAQAFVRPTPAHPRARCSSRSRSRPSRSALTIRFHSSSSCPQPTRAEQPRPLGHPAVALGVEHAVDGDVVRIRARRPWRARGRSRRRARGSPRHGSTPCQKKWLGSKLTPRFGPAARAQPQRRLDVVDEEARDAARAPPSRRGRRRSRRRRVQYGIAFSSHCQSSTSRNSGGHGVVTQLGCCASSDVARAAGEGHDHRHVELLGQPHRLAERRRRRRCAVRAIGMQRVAVARQRADGQAGVGDQLAVGLRVARAVPSSASRSR